MLIILEGANRTGKSTFAKELVDYKGATIIDNKYLNAYMEDIKQETFISGLSTLSVLNSIQQKGKIYILDRFYLSELVYGKLLRGYENGNCKKLEQILNKMSFKTIMVLFITEEERLRRIDDKLVNIQNEFIKRFEEVSVNGKVYLNLDSLFGDCDAAKRNEEIRKVIDTCIEGVSLKED